MSMADRMRELAPADRTYASPDEFYDLVLSIDPTATTEVYRKMVINFADGSQYEMQGLHKVTGKTIPVSDMRQ